MRNKILPPRNYQHQLGSTYMALAVDTVSHDDHCTRQKHMLAAMTGAEFVRHARRRLLLLTEAHVMLPSSVASSFSL